MTLHRLRRIGKLLRNGLPILDKRGHHGNRANATSIDVKAQIDEHIRSFPYQVTHYSTVKKRYLRGESNWGLCVVTLSISEGLLPRLRPPNGVPKVHSFV